MVVGNRDGPGAGRDDDMAGKSMARGAAVLAALTASEEMDGAAIQRDRFLTVARGHYAEGIRRSAQRHADYWNTVAQEASVDYCTLLLEYGITPEEIEAAQVREDALDALDLAGIEYEVVAS